jgi:hypothetical protein
MIKFLTVFFITGFALFVSVFTISRYVFTKHPNSKVADFLRKNIVTDQDLEP